MGYRNILQQGVAPGLIKIDRFLKIQSYFKWAVPRGILANVGEIARRKRNDDEAAN